MDLAKELWADPYFEGEPFLWDGITDWLEYWAGIAIAGVAAYLLAAAFHLHLRWI